MFNYEFAFQQDPRYILFVKKTDKLVRRYSEKIANFDLKLCTDNMVKKVIAKEIRHDMLGTDGKHDTVKCEPCVRLNKKVEKVKSYSRGLLMFFAITATISSCVIPIILPTIPLLVGLYMNI